MSFDNAVSAASPAAGGGVPAASPFAVAADVEQQAASRQPSTMWEDVERQVVCNIEFQGDSTTKVLLWQFYFALAAATAMLVWEAVTKFGDADEQFVQFNWLEVANVVFASLCLAILLWVGGLLAWRVWQVNRAGKLWAKRRQRTVELTALELIVQIVNTCFYLAPNAYVLAKPCSWFTTTVHVCSFIRWTCWNSLYCLFVVQAHNPMPAHFNAQVMLQTALSGAMHPVRAAGLMAQRAAGEVGRGAATLATGAADLAVGAADMAVDVAAGAADLAAAAVPGALRRGASLQRPRWRRRADQHAAGKAAAAAAKETQDEVDDAAAAIAEAASIASADAAAAADVLAGKAVGTTSRGELDGPTMGEEWLQDEDEEMVADLDSGRLGFKSHWLKAVLLWLPCQVTVIVWMAMTFTSYGDHEPPCGSISDTRCYPQAVNGTTDCRDWAYDCKPTSRVLVLSSLATAFLIVTLLIYFAYTWFAWRELGRRSYVHYRTNNVMLRLQFLTRLWAAVFLALCTVLFWYIGEASCSSYMSVMLGLTPIQIVMTSLTVLNCVCVLPGDTSRRVLELRVWLQDFAWTEADLPRKLAARPLPPTQPMFCVETAIKLLCWSWAVYFDEGEPPEEEGARAEAAEAGAGKAAEGMAPAAVAAEPAVDGAPQQQQQQQGSGGAAIEGGAQSGDAGAAADHIAIEAAGAAGAAAEAASGVDPPLDPTASPAKLPVPTRSPSGCGDAAPSSSGSQAGDPSAGAGSRAGSLGGTPGEDLDLHTALAMYGLTQWRELWGPDHDAKALVGWGGPTQGGTAQDAQGGTQGSAPGGTQSGVGGTVVVCFRGTCSLRNAWNNLKVWRAPHPPPRGSYWLTQRPMVHWGFSETWAASGLGEQVMAVLREILSTSPPSSSGTWRLLFTGHSLGGALASLAAYEAVQLCQELFGPGGEAPPFTAPPRGPPAPPSAGSGSSSRGGGGGGGGPASSSGGGGRSGRGGVGTIGSPAWSVQCYTFGAPRPGNHAFARDYIGVVPASFDVIHTDDTVVRNGKFLFLYKRAAHRVVLSDTGDLIVRPSRLERTVRESWGTSLQQHLLSAYGRSFAKIMRAQFQQQKEFNGGRRGCLALLHSEQVQRVLRVTAGVRQESLVRLGRLDSGLAHNAYLQEQAAAAESAAAGSRGRRPARGSVGGADDRHLARGERLTPAQQTAAQLASHLSAPDGLLTVAPMLSAPLIARLSSLRAARSVSRRPLQLRRARSLSPLKRVGAAAVHQDGLVSGQRVADVV